MLNMYNDILFAIFVINYKTGEYETELSTLSLATSVVVPYERQFYALYKYPPQQELKHSGLNLADWEDQSVLLPTTFCNVMLPGTGGDNFLDTAYCKHRSPQDVTMC